MQENDMIFDDDLQDDERHLSGLFREIDQTTERTDPDLLAELDAIGKADAAPAPTMPEQRVIRVPNTTFKDPDPNDPDTIIHEAKLTRWDRASRKLRDLQAKYDALPADYPAHKVALLDVHIRIAREAVERAKSDVSRRQEGIDLWRADAGRVEYNENRRTTDRGPNADLSDLTEPQKVQRKKDQRSDANWIARRRKAGIPEPRIQAELITRIQAREAKRAEQAALEDLPGFGTF